MSQGRTGLLEEAERCNFNHPFEHPYDVQLKLMEAIYSTIDGDYKVGIFESPTGTGKTLSLICSTMTWLREFKRLKNEASIKKMEGEEGDDDEPEWVKKAYKEKIVDRILDDAKRYEKHLEELEKDGPRMITGDVKGRGGRGNGRGTVRYFKKAKKMEAENDDSVDDDVAPEDYFEVEDATSNRSKYEQVDSDVKRLLEEVETVRSDMRKQQSTEVNESPIKIYFASRTHSQLTQFCSQLRMTEFPSSIEGVHEKIKYLPLGSRKQLCINEEVVKLKDTQQINERCIELQKRDKGTTGSCPYMPNLNSSQDVELVDQFRDMSYSSVQDIEDLDNIGNDLKICPYYSTRQGVPVAEIISLPYQLLLQRDSRQSLKLPIKDSIVVIDEAHNLIDTINSIYSSSISFGELKLVRKGLRMYTKRFYSKMNAGNRINLSKLIKLISLLTKFVAKQIDLNKASPGTGVDVNQIFAGTTGDLLNVYPLQVYINKSKIAFKLQTYMDKEAGKKSGTPLLFKIRSFMYCLSNTSESGKFFFDGKGTDNVFLKYLLLDPSEPFKEIVEESRCVLLAGGTMEPVADFTDFLLPYVEKDRVNTFSCDHIIPDSNLEVYPISNSGNTPFEFTFGKRSNERMLDVLGRSVIRILRVVPAGVVFFFPSYHYLDEVIGVWKKRGLIKEMEKNKTIFIESREGNVDDILKDYSTEIRLKGKGSVLFSVVGGKMSEGINFSDELARAVVMIGLPYPNVKSGDLIAKSHYIEMKTIQNGGTQQMAKNRSNEMYTNICMKAVNQSVGRAIRNIKDYAVIYLIDVRYGGKAVQEKLSGWIQKRLEGCSDIGEAIDRTVGFFSSKEDS
ncbi:DEKNAAC102243 [Brettanomyces naardenensis]|uniref:ATP-dependent DNA helicase CHL1 n=1 Tax=Brettanomyces naardenensis TaxID=13370 RepID=A0A448YLM3_BRENA|nr:DEKNAAC102243 [Brettanomyces naardenensis]